MVVFENIPEFLRPRLRLFFGVDLVGSTSFKQSGEYPLEPPDEKDSLAAIGVQWFSKIANFYRHIEEEFGTSWSRCCEAYSDCTSQQTFNVKPRTWKAIGDELIFEVELSKPTDVSYVLCAWIKALRSYRIELKTTTPNLDIKGSAWIAGFPICNAEVVFKTDFSTESSSSPEDPRLLHFMLLKKWYEGGSERIGYVKDYVGPSIDTGFRISAHASPRKFPVSIEVAYFLAAQPPIKDFLEKYGLEKDVLSLYFDGMHSLKGVLGGSPYPVFWIDFLCHDAMTTSLKTLTNEIPVSSDAIRNFSEKFFNEHKNYIFPPFIANCPVDDFSRMPKNYEETIKRMGDIFTNEEKKWNDLIEMNTKEKDDQSSSDPTQVELDQFLTSAFPKI